MYKKQCIFLVLVIIFVSLLIVADLSLVFAETLILKSGSQVQGKIIEKTDQYIKIEVEGAAFSYTLDEIERVEEDVPSLTQENVPQASLESPSIEKYTSEARQYYLNGEYENALSSLKKAIELDPNQTNLFASLGVLYYHLGNSEDAISSFEKALSFKSADPIVYLCLWVVYDSAGRQEESKENLIKAVEYYKEKDLGYYAFVAEVLLKKIDNKQ